MRRFIDLHLRPSEDSESVRAMLELAARLEFKEIGLVRGEIHSRNLKSMASGMGLDLVSRVDLAPRNTNELTAALRRLRRRFMIVAVECRSKNVARQAAKDHRVDILNFPSSVSARSRNRFDRQEASLASDANCAYEINASDLLQPDQVSRAKLLSLMRGEVDNAKRFDVPIVVSSGALNAMQMRDPRGLAAILTILDMNEEEGLESVSKTPMRIVTANREKLEPGFVAPGVRRV
jgi:ribonuclease P/MRP protein subunit RPP1